MSWGALIGLIPKVLPKAIKYINIAKPIYAMGKKIYDAIKGKKKKIPKAKSSLEHALSIGDTHTTRNIVNSRLRDAREAGKKRQSAKRKVIRTRAAKQRRK